MNIATRHIRHFWRPNEDIQLTVNPTRRKHRSVDAVHCVTVRRRRLPDSDRRRRRVADECRRVQLEQVAKVLAHAQHERAKQVDEIDERQFARPGDDQLVAVVSPRSEHHAGTAGAAAVADPAEVEGQVPRVERARRRPGIAASGSRDARATRLRRRVGLTDAGQRCVRRFGGRTVSGATAAAAAAAAEPEPDDGLECRTVGDSGLSFRSVVVGRRRSEFAAVLC